MDLPTTPMLLAAAGGLVTEAVSFWLLYRRQQGSLIIRGAFWHILQTLVGSVIIIVSALVIRFTGFLEIDPLLGMAFGLVLFWASWRIIRDSLTILLQGTPRDLNLNAAIEASRRVPGGHRRASRACLEPHVGSQHLLRPRGGRGAAEGQQVLQTVHDLLKRQFGIYFSTVQIEERCLEGEEEAAEIDILRAGARP